jgi:hypothetical protein
VGGGKVGTGTQANGEDVGYDVVRRDWNPATAAAEVTVRAGTDEVQRDHRKGSESANS